MRAFHARAEESTSVRRPPRHGLGHGAVSGTDAYSRSGRPQMQRSRPVAPSCPHRVFAFTLPGMRHCTHGGCTCSAGCSTVVSAAVGFPHCRLRPLCAHRANVLAPTMPSCTGPTRRCHVPRHRREVRRWCLTRGSSAESDQASTTVNRKEEPHGWTWDESPARAHDGLRGV
jgi:hypothetical protein